MDACRWTHLASVPAWIPAPHLLWASLLPLFLSALTTPHSCLHSLRLNVCWDWWHLLLLPESDTIFSACWMGTPRQCLWLAVAPESALPHSHIPTLAQHPTSHRPNVGPVHMTCGVLMTVLCWHFLLHAGCVRGVARRV